MIRKAWGADLDGIVIPFRPRRKLADNSTTKSSVNAWTARDLYIAGPGGAELHIVIGEDGTLWRRLPACGRDVKVLGRKYQPITAEPLQSRQDAEALAARVREVLA